MTGPREQDRTVNQVLWLGDQLCLQANIEQVPQHFVCSLHNLGIALLHRETNI